MMAAKLEFSGLHRMSMDEESLFFFFNYLKTNIKMLSSSWRINFITFLFQQLLLMVLQIKKEPLGSVKWRRGCFRFWDWKVVVLPSIEAISVWVVAKIQQGEEMGRESRSFFVYLFFLRWNQFCLQSLKSEPNQPNLCSSLCLSVLVLCLRVLILTTQLSSFSY
jgi:hypothetical protein